MHRKGARGLTLQVLHGDCLDLLPTLDADSISAVVTDPPYHLTSMVQRLSRTNGAEVEKNFTKICDGQATNPFAAMARGFMGKSWDGGDIAFRPDTWRAVLRVMKPGAYMVCFGGTRTAHRLACAIEDAGFEIRDTLCWLYGSGFPKSLDVSKAIDKAAGATREVVGSNPNARTTVTSFKNDGRVTVNAMSDSAVTAPATPEAQQWSGWGTALKPAHEPIILARKPLQGSVATNVLRHGTGAINVDACRVGDGGQLKWATPRGMGSEHSFADDAWTQAQGRPYAAATSSAVGRWPANVLHDGSPEVLDAFARFGTDRGQQAAIRGDEPSVPAKGDVVYGFRDRVPFAGHGDTGTAARFFYSAKADASDRADSRHPTVKPVALMRWLVRLITPPGGTVLDPFAGSGTTGEAAMLEGRDALLIEREAQHAEDIAHRINRWSGADCPLFTEAAD